MQGQSLIVKAKLRMDALGAEGVDTLFTLYIFDAPNDDALIAQVPLHFAFRVRARP